MSTAGAMSASGDGLLWYSPGNGMNSAPVNSKFFPFESCVNDASNIGCLRGLDVADGLVACEELTDAFPESTCFEFVILHL